MSSFGPYRVSVNKKFQITNTKQITMTEIQNSKQLAFDLILDFVVWNLFAQF
jgi:hypothetical protein